MIDALKQLFFGGSASECLRSAIEIPLLIDSTDFSGSLEQLYLGNYPCIDNLGNNINGYKIGKPIVGKTVSISIPWVQTDWRAISAYTDIALYIPFIGILSMPASEIHSADSSLSVRFAVNITSGDIAVEVKGGTSGRIYATASGNCALNTPYGSTGIDTNRATSAIVSGIGTIVSIGAAVASGGASAAVTAGIGAGLSATALNTIAAMGGNASGSGGLGGGASSQLTGELQCYVITKQLADSPTNLYSIIGKPLSKKATISSYSGYVQTDGFQFASSRALSEEKDLINSMLDSGIYYE